MTVGYLTYPRHTQIRRFLHWREHEHRSCVRTRSGDWFQFSRALQALGGMYGHCQTVILLTCIRFPVLGWSISRISTWRSFLYVAQIVSHGFSIFTETTTFTLRSINYLELNPAQASTKEEDSPPKPTIFGTERAAEDTEASGNVAVELVPDGQGKANAE